ncbi:hypothetical protein [Enterococcus lactis]|uniref:hypothetical protein n=1 Tax=Enterococcus lactis TaxID=357441 RepID=UPI00237BAC6E|nr:hypothetical protein [Enterococcus lactis]
MIEDTESLKAAQQILCTAAINNLNDALNLFTQLRHIDGRAEKGRQILAEELIDVEERLRSVQHQIYSIRNLYMEV